MMFDKNFDKRSINRQSDKRLIEYVKIAPKTQEEEVRGTFFPPAIINFAQTDDLPQKNNNPFHDCVSPIDEAAI